MNKIVSLFTLASVGLFAGSASAQAVYGGVGLPGIYNIGYAHSFSKSFGVRVQHASGLDYSKTGDYEGVPATANLKSTDTGLFADWYPFQGGFRIVGGVTQNDVKAQINAGGSGFATINGQSVNMTGERYNMAVKFSDTTPYLGIGYGHNQGEGWGFYFDFGVKFGKFEVKSDQTLVANGKVTQADIDAQDQKVRDSVSGIGVLPVLQIGVGYTF